MIDSRLQGLAEVIQRILNLARVGTDLVEDVAAGLLGRASSVRRGAAKAIARGDALRHDCVTGRPADEVCLWCCVRFAGLLRGTRGRSREEGRGAGEKETKQQLSDTSTVIAKRPELAGDARNGIRSRAGADGGALTSWRRWEKVQEESGRGGWE